MCNNAQMENWDDLKYALAIYRHGTLSGAARTLGVNHATVSRRLSTLETQMGARLFDRMSDGLHPTEHGEKAIESAIEIERHVLSLEVSIAAKDTVLAGPLKISAPQLIVQLKFADILAEFKALYPQIDLQIIATLDAVNLHRREADVSIRVVNEPENTLWGQRVLQQNCMYYASRSYLEQRQEQDPLNCLNFMWRGDQPAPEVLKAYPNARVIARFDDMVAVYGAVNAGMGIARMPCFIGDSNPTFQRVPHIDSAPYHDLWILTHPDLRKVPRIQAFMRFAATRLRKLQPFFLGELST